MMADCPGHPHPPAFSWNAGMVMHILEEDPTLRDLEHIQVDGPGMAYLFFFDKQDCRGLAFDASQTLRTHVGEAFAEWISCSVHYAVIPLPLAEGWYQAVAASEWCQKGPGQSIKAAPCQILLPVSQTPHCHWWEVSHLLLCAWVRQGNQEAAKPLRWQPLDCGEDPLRLAPLKMAPETCHHLARTEEELIQMGIPQQVRHLVAITAEGGSKVRNVLHPHVWTCRFLNQLTLMWM